MKKLIIFFLAIMLLPGVVAYAGPFLTCDDTPVVDQVTSFELVMDNGTAIQHPGVAGILAGSKKIMYDLAGITSGAHVAKARALNLWGVSADSVPLAFTKSLPSVPTILRLAP